jgi:hypothetical protein
MKLIPHNYHWAVGKTVLWDTSDNEARYLKNLADPKKKLELERLGYIDATITYAFNSHGFRTQEFDQPADAVCFGCSYTMGTGLFQHHTWPAQLTEISGLTTINLGHAGSSNDTALRMAMHYLPILKPRYAFWLQTAAHRIEILDDRSDLCVNLLGPNDQSDDFYYRDNFVKQWFASDSNQQIHLEKNTRAFKHLCNELDIICVVFSQNTSHDKIVQFDLARDLMHPGTESNRALAEKFARALDLGGKSTQ